MTPSNLDPIFNRPTCPLCGMDWTTPGGILEHMKVLHLQRHGLARQTGSAPFAGLEGLFISQCPCPCGEVISGDTLLSHLGQFDDPLLHLITAHTINLLAANVQ